MQLLRGSSLSYLGLARKWRPQIFSDLVGQEHIATTLTNAITKGRISQGYLFTGTRGIGKTSAARILAKALRCTNPIKPGIPCGKCQDCIEVAEGRSIDVHEIDGASNNGVDAVREIRENAKFLPASGKYKIYIVDEVHMLTTAAFNALLKTLEEPPPHVIFIFATTDPQKIPETVLSRTQRFDFKRVSQKDLLDRLEEICKTEKISIAKDALAILAREAEGSMRDGVSLLDQILSVAEGKEIGAQELARALGLVDKRTILECVEGILNRKPLDALDAVGKVYMHGFDLKQYGREVLRYIRTIMVAKLLEENKADVSQFIEITDVDLKDVKALTGSRSLDDLDMLFRMLNHGLEDVARSAIPKMVMDVLIIKMSAAVDLVTLDSFEEPAVAAAPRVTMPPQQTVQTAPVRAQAAPTPVAAPKPAAAPVLPPPTSFSMDWWKGVIQYVKNQKPLFGTVLENLAFVSGAMNGETIEVVLSYTKETSFYKDQLSNASNRDLLQQVMKNFLTRNVSLQFIEGKATAEKAAPASINQMEETDKREKFEAKKKKVLESEAFKATQQLLGAKLEKFEIKGE